MGRRIVLVSHDGMAKGVLGAANMICGESAELSAFGLEPDGSVAELGEQVRSIAVSHPEDQLIVVADLLGGSVCNQCLQSLADCPNTTIVAGLSLPLVLALATREGELSAEDIDEAVGEAVSMTKRVEIASDDPATGEDDFF